jgi:hypothetical protein
MKRRLLFLLTSTIVSCFYLSAQSKNIITVKAGHTIKETLSPTDVYQYPQFNDGFVFFKNGKTAHSRLNYNHFLDNLEYINTQGDTMSLTNGKDVKLVTIGTDTFFYNNGFVKLVSRYGHMNLGVKQTLPIVSKEKMTDGYGSYSTINNVESYDSYSDGLKLYGLVQMQNLNLANKTQYFIANEDNGFIMAVKKNVLKLFPKQKDQVEAYLKQNAVNFEKEEDMVKLIQYLGDL